MDTRPLSEAEQERLERLEVQFKNWSDRRKAGLLMRAGETPDRDDQRDLDELQKRAYATSRQEPPLRRLRAEVDRSGQTFFFVRPRACKNCSIRI
jgi:hypothetical protein